jgi:hypothetical protein
MARDIRMNKTMPKAFFAYGCMFSFERRIDHLVHSHSPSNFVLLSSNKNPNHPLPAYFKTKKHLPFVSLFISFSSPTRSSFRLIFLPSKTHAQNPQTRAYLTLPPPTRVVPHAGVLPNSALPISRMK